MVLRQQRPLQAATELFLGMGELQGLRKTFYDERKDRIDVGFPDTVDLLASFAKGQSCGEGVCRLEDIEDELWRQTW